MTSPWFDEQALVWIGPTVGIAEALWGGAVGLLGYYLVRKGRGRPFVYGYLWAGLLVAIGFLAGGALGVFSGQPTMISASLLICGGPLLAAAAISFVNVVNLYRLAELRRMQAMEI